MGRPGVFDEPLQAAARQLGIERQVGAAGSQDRQDGAQKLEGAFEADGHQVLPTHAAGAQAPSQLLHLPVELTIASASPSVSPPLSPPGDTRDQGDALSDAFAVGGEELMYRAMRILWGGERGWVEILQDFPALGFAEQVEGFVARLGIVHHGVYDPREIPPKLLDLAVGEEVRIDGQVKTHLRRERIDTEIDHQGKTGGLVEGPPQQVQLREAVEILEDVVMGEVKTGFREPATAEPFLDLAHRETPMGQSLAFRFEDLADQLAPGAPSQDETKGHAV